MRTSIFYEGNTLSTSLKITNISHLLLLSGQSRGSAGFIANQSFETPAPTIQRSPSLLHWLAHYENSPLHAPVVLSTVSALLALAGDGICDRKQGEWLTHTCRMDADQGAGRRAGINRWGKVNATQNDTLAGPVRANFLVRLHFYCCILP